MYRELHRGDKVCATFLSAIACTDCKNQIENICYHGEYDEDAGRALEVITIVYPNECEELVVTGKSTSEMLSMLARHFSETFPLIEPKKG